VLVFSYNHEKYLNTCLKSISNQIFDKTFHCLIADDCSSDSSQQIIKSFIKNFPNSFSYIKRQENLGKFTGGNGRYNALHAYSLSKSKYIAVLDGDDYWTDPYKLQKQVDYLEANPDCSITSHQVLDIDEKGNLLKKDKRKVFEKSLIIKKYQYFDENFNETASQPGSWVFRTSLVNSLPNIITKVIYGDDLMWIHFLNHGYAYIFNNEMSCYRHHTNGIWSRKTPIQKCINQIINFKIISSYYKYDLFSLKNKKLLQNIDDWLFSSNDFFRSISVSLKIFKDNPKHIIYLLPFFNLLCKKFILQYFIPRVIIYVGKIKAFLW
jgi:glycosyltransferase involved in cell wall biosynthesis